MADLDLTSTLHLVASVQPDLNEMLLSPDVNEQRSWAKPSLLGGCQMISHAARKVDIPPNTDWLVLIALHTLASHSHHQSIIRGRVADVRCLELRLTQHSGGGCL